MGKNITDFKNALVYIVYQLVFLGKTLESLQFAAYMQVERPDGKKIHHSLV